jgi:hypothetical protein
VLTFVRSARSTPGVLRIALLGSLATDKPVPKDADVLNDDLEILTLSSTLVSAPPMQQHSTDGAIHVTLSLPPESAEGSAH